MKTKTKAWAFSIVALVLVIAVLVGIKAGQIGTMIKAGKSFVPPPESVTSAKVESREWESTRSAIGTLVA
ncbi:MAG: efflux transporter periplasmic adaptor subunit, partial [Anaeromyxobacteraceae bacterium]